jgi:hypothetical protein
MKFELPAVARERLGRGLRMFFWTILVLAVVAAMYLFVGPSSPREDVTWGVNFSAKHTRNLGLDWKEVYTALLDDLKIRHIKLAAHWDYIEPKQESFDWADTDWQFAEAEKRGAKLVPVIGMKTPRWPECHIPEWAKGFDKGSLQFRSMHYVEEFVKRYKDSPAIEYWQVENEPFFGFGDCPFLPGDELLAKEVAIVRRLDPDHKIMITDTGEFSFWVEAAKAGDIVGHTLYRKVWFKQLGVYWTYPIPPVFYSRKAALIRNFMGKQVIDAELQAEPWGPTLYYDLPIEEQMKTMPIEQLRANIDFAKRTGMRQAFFWGDEWWYWMKVKHNDPSYWEEVKALVAKTP